jgi:hypothetical protein
MFLHEPGAEGLLEMNREVRPFTMKSPCDCERPWDSIIFMHELEGRLVHRLRDGAF